MGKYGGGHGGHHHHSSGGGAMAKNDAQVRDARRNVEEQGGFDWTPVVLLGVMGATALFSFDRAYQKHTEHKEDEEKQYNSAKGKNDDDEERRRRERERARSLDEWSEDEERAVDENGFYVGRRRGRSRGAYDPRYEERYDSRYERGYSADYHDRYGGASRRGTSTW